ncbi:MAG: toxin-antitoxin system YwqK family antitoxin [Cellvibrionaceae bacterium]
MRNWIVFIVALSFSSGLWSAPFDYTKIKPEHYKDLKHRSEFVDKDGQSFRIENSEYSKGLYIQVVKNGSKKWRKHGVFYSYYKGKMTEMETYSYGKREGLRESYQGKGVINFREYYQNGRRHGSWEQFNSKGKLVAQCNYSNGDKQGKYYSYYNGKVDFEKDYVDNKLHGEVIQFNSKGKIVARTQYSKGKQVGKTQWY